MGYSDPNYPLLNQEVFEIGSLDNLLLSGILLG
jgi:hypothetical protein